MIRFIGGVTMALVALMGGFILEGGYPPSLIGLSALLITFLMPLFAVLAVWRWKQWIQAWSHAFKKAESTALAKVSVDIWKFSELVCYLAGLIGWMIGMVLILGNVDGLFTEKGVAPAQAAMFSHALAASLIAPIYGIVFGFVCRILRARVESVQS